MKPDREMGLGDLSMRMQEDLDRAKTGRITQQSIQAEQSQTIQAKARQGIKMDPTDDVHNVTHQPPENY